jgi:hypothetical protein
MRSGAATRPLVFRFSLTAVASIYRIKSLYFHFLATIRLLL